MISFTQHDSADHGGEEQDGTDLERQHEVFVQRLAEVVDQSDLRTTRASGAGTAALRSAPTSTIISKPPATVAAIFWIADLCGSTSAFRFSIMITYRKSTDDGAGIDDHVHRGQKLGVEQDVMSGDGEKVMIRYNTLCTGLRETTTISALRMERKERK